jgi:hypothetical protein
MRRSQKPLPATRPARFPVWPLGKPCYILSILRVWAIPKEGLLVHRGGTLDALEWRPRAFVSTAGRFPRHSRRGRLPHQRHFLRRQAVGRVHQVGDLLFQRPRFRRRRLQRDDASAVFLP